MRAITVVEFGPESFMEHSSGYSRNVNRLTRNYTERYRLTRKVFHAAARPEILRHWIQATLAKLTGLRPNTQQGTAEIGMSAAIVVAVCEDVSPLAPTVAATPRPLRGHSFLDTKCPSDSPSTPAGVTGLSSPERKIAADTPVTSGWFLARSCLRRR